MDQALQQLPSMDRLLTETTDALHYVSSLKCTNEDEYKKVSAMFKWAKARKKEIKSEDEWKKLESQIKVLDGLHAQACALRKRVIDPYDQVENKSEEIMRPYVQKKRLEEEADRRKLQAEADKKAKQDKELLELQAMLEGAPEEAAIIAEMPVVTAPVKVEAAVPKQEGMSTKENWKWKIKNLDLIPDIYWSLNEKLINSTVKAQGKLCQIPGIEVYDDVSFAG